MAEMRPDYVFSSIRNQPGCLAFSTQRRIELCFLVRAAVHRAMPLMKHRHLSILISAVTIVFTSPDGLNTAVHRAFAAIKNCACMKALLYIRSQPAALASIFTPLCACTGGLRSLRGEEAQQREVELIIGGEYCSTPSASKCGPRTRL